MSIDKCIMDVMPICALLFRQTEGILENYCILAPSFSAKVSTKVLGKN